MRKVALIRGRYMNKAEMCNYEPLCAYYDITGYVNQLHYYDVSRIKFPLVILPALSFLPNKANKFLDYLFDKISEKFVGPNKYMLGLEKNLRDKDIIHVDYYYAYTFQAIRAKEKYGTKIVVTFWENIPFNPEFYRPKMKEKIKTRIFNNTDFFIAASERAKETLIFEGVPENKIKVLYLGVDLDRFKPRPRRFEFMKMLDIKEDQMVILFAGGIEERKGFRFLMLAAKKILDDQTLNDFRIKFLVVGREVGDIDVRRLVHELGISEHITFTSFIPYDHIPYIYNLADLFVLPSVPRENWQEQFGMVLVESMASGVSTISTLSGSIPEVVGDAGVIVQSADFLALYEALKKLILNKKLRLNLAQKGRERAERIFDCKLVSSQIREVYENLFS